MTVNYEIGRPRVDRRMRVSILLCIGRTKKRVRTDYFVSKSDLNRKGKIRNDSPIYNKVISKMRDLEREYSALDTFLTGERITATEAIGRIGKKDLPTFFEYADRWLSRADMKGKKNYSSALNSFKSFVGGDISFSMFSHRLLDDYCYSLKDKKRAQSLYLNAIKKIYDDAEKEYDIIPFSKFRFEIPRQNQSTHRALDADIIRLIFSYQGTGRAGLARDCCILSFCLMGTNAADLYNAPKIKGETLCYERTKTKGRRADNAYIEIIIPKQIRPLIKKYKGETKAFRFHKDYSTSDNFGRAINIGLKDIKDWLKKKGVVLDTLTFYSMRHSYATIARNDLKIDKSTIHELLNHRERETAIDDIYIRRDFSLINEANKKVVDYIFRHISAL